MEINNDVYIKVTVAKDSKPLASNAKIASGFLDRLIGLMFKKEMIGYDGLLIKHCSSIHTFFMLYKIDVIFLDKEFTIQKIIRDMKPWRVSAISFKSTQVLELKGGTLDIEVNKGDKLEVVCIN